MKKNITKRICSVLLSAVLALPLFLTSGFTAGGEGEDNPTLSFQNEKYDGIKVFKNIYTNEEYYKENRQPIRVANAELGDIYDINDLAYDEFRLVLYGADDKDELYKASQRPPMTNIRFQRKLGSLLYYNLKQHQDGKDLILAPHDISDYFLYYSNADGTIRIVFDSRDSYYTHKDTASPTEAETLEASQYAALTYHEKYLQDGAYYTASGTDAQKAVFANFALASPDFYTGADDGSFFIFDGDIAYFDESVLDKKYVRVKETWESIRALNEERRESPDAAQYTGEYVYMIDDDVVTDVIAASQSGALEVANRFDEPTHELTVSKTVPFFGVAPSDVNPFRTSDIFEYKLLINNKVPASAQYTLLDTKTNLRTPTAAEKDEDNVTYAGGEYRYIAENGVFYLCAEQTAVFYGVKNNDRVEIREYTDPDRYSVLSQLSGNAEFRYVSRDDPANDETPPRDYASITVQYGEGTNQRNDPTFTNVPNVLQVKKRVEETTINTEYEFAFTIQKLQEDPANPGHPLKDAEDAYVIDESVSPTYTYYVRDGDSNYDPAARTAVDGVFYLRHDQTAMFVGLKADSLYLVTESGDPAYNLRDGNARVLNTRGETVEDALIRSKSGNYYELFVNERDEMRGIVLTKKVTDSDGRLNQKAVFMFRLEMLNRSTGEYEPAADMEYSYKNGASDLLSGSTDANGYFRVNCNLNNFVVKFPTANGTYRITEVDPNDWNDQNNQTGTAAPNPQHEEYLYITDVDCDIYDVQDPQAPKLWKIGSTQTFNDDTAQHTDDIVIDGVTVTLTHAASVEFTNRIREKTYYLDIEKLAYLDDNIHDGKADTTQRFQFKIERFDKQADALSSTAAAQETFYTDLSCTEKFKVIDNGEGASPRYLYTADGKAYPYPFYAIDYSYTGRDSGENSVVYADEIVTRTYKKADTAAVYRNGDSETYKFFSTIYRGCRQLAVQKQGYYRITEICDWSNTDYDYCLRSNRYKGYLDTAAAAQNRLFFDYQTTHAEGYPAANGVLDRAVVIYVGALADQVYPYTLGCESFADTKGTVSYVTAAAQDVPVQARDASGSLLYYVTGTEGNTTTEKYDAAGSRRSPVPAQFRVQEQSGGTLLYFKNSDESLTPVYQYAEGLDMSKFETEEAEDSEGNTVTQKKGFPVYDGSGAEVAGVLCHRLLDENEEASYKHITKTWSSTVYTLQETETVLRPTASFSNVESEYALLSSNAWADNRILRAAETDE